MAIAPTIAELAKKHNIRALKKLGQNFIFDMSLCEKITRASKLPPNSYVLEIGPGTAGLTRAILKENPAALTVIEADSRFLPLLQEIQREHTNLEVITGDALKFDITSLNQRELHIISNLPYNIGTKLLINWLKQIDYISSITIMLQKEVVERIKAKPNCKEYGRLSIICNLICEVEKCFDVSHAAFYPPPKVTSAVVRLVPKQNRPSNSEIQKLERITQQAFSARRKTLKSSLKGLELEGLEINLSARAENLSPEEYLAIACFKVNNNYLFNY